MKTHALILLLRLSSHRCLQPCSVVKYNPVWFIWSIRVLIIRSIVFDWPLVNPLWSPHPHRMTNLCWSSPVRINRHGTIRHIHTRQSWLWWMRVSHWQRIPRERYVFGYGRRISLVKWTLIFFFFTNPTSSNNLYGRFILFLSFNSWGHARSI